MSVHVQKKKEKIGRVFAKNHPETKISGNYIYFTNLKNIIYQKIISKKTLYRQIKNCTCTDTDKMENSYNLHGKKVRMNITTRPEVYNILKKASKKNRMSMSKVIERLVIDHVSDRKQFIMNEKRLLAKRMNELDEELKYIELGKE